MADTTESKGGAAAADRITLNARLEVFGSEPRAASLDVTPRPRAKRAARAAATGAATLVGAALVGILPPHAPWILGALAFGGWRTRAEWRGEYRLHGFTGECPRCGQALALTDRYITPPLVVPCYACHAQVQLSLEAGPA